MALTRKQLDDILKANSTASSDAWSSAVKQGRDRDAALAQLITGQQLKDQSESEQNARNMQQVKDLRGLLGKDASVRVGDVSIDPRNYEMLRMQQGLSEKEADNKRLETAALQNEYNKLSGKSRDQLQALKDIENLIANPSSVTEGQLRTALARAAGDVGALSEGDVQRALPSTLGTDIRRGWNYITGGTSPAVRPEQMEAVKRLVGTKRASLEGRMSGAGQELRTRASTLAPTLNRTRELDKTMQGLGVGSISGQDPLEAINRRIQELEAKKAGR